MIIAEFGTHPPSQPPQASLVWGPKLGTSHTLYVCCNAIAMPWGGVLPAHPLVSEGNPWFPLLLESFSKIFLKGRGDGTSFFALPPSSGRAEGPPDSSPIPSSELGGGGMCWNILVRWCFSVNLERSTCNLYPTLEPYLGPSLGPTRTPMLQPPSLRSPPTPNDVPVHGSLVLGPSVTLLHSFHTDLKSP